MCGPRERSTHVTLVKIKLNCAKQFLWTGIGRRGVAPSVIRFRELADAAVVALASDQACAARIDALL